MGMEQLQQALRKIKELEDNLNSHMCPVPGPSLDEDLDAAEQARCRAEQELDAARKRLQELLSKGDSSADLDRARRELANAEGELKKAHSLIAQLKAKIRELEDELRRLRAEMSSSKDAADRANEEWLSEQARRKRLEEDELRRKREEERLRKEKEDADRRKEAANRKALLQKKEGDTENNLMKRVLAHWLQRSMLQALNSWRDEAAFLRRIDMIMRRVALRWKKDKAYKLLVKLRDYAEAKRIKDLEFQAYLTKTKTPTSRARASSKSAYISPFQSPKHTSTTK